MKKMRDTGHFISRRMNGIFMLIFSVIITCMLEGDQYQQFSENFCDVHLMFGAN